MSLPVNWTPEAEETFSLIIIYLESNWGDNTAKKFVANVNQKIKLISKQPFLAKAVGHKEVRLAVITKQTSLLYRVHNNHIEILFFFDNRQEPFLQI